MNLLSFSEGCKLRGGKKITFHGYFLEVYFTDCSMSCHAILRMKTNKQKVFF